MPYFVTLTMFLNLDTLVADFTVMRVLFNKK